MTHCGIIFSSDGKSWADYLAGVLQQKQSEDAGPLIQFKCHEDHKALLDPTYDIINYYGHGNCTCVVVISPGLVKFLKQNPDANVASVLNDPSRGVLFYCGVEDKYVQSRLQCRFPHFSSWVRVTCEKISGIVNPTLDVINKNNQRWSSGYDSSTSEQNDLLDVQAMQMQRLTLSEKQNDYIELIPDNESQMKCGQTATVVNSVNFKEQSVNGNVGKQESKRMDSPAPKPRLRAKNNPGSIEDVNNLNEARRESCPDLKNEDDVHLTLVPAVVDCLNPGTVALICNRVLPNESQISIKMQSMADDRTEVVLTSSDLKQQNPYSYIFKPPACGQAGKCSVKVMLRNELVADCCLTYKTPKDQFIKKCGQLCVDMLGVALEKLSPDDLRNFDHAASNLINSQESTNSVNNNGTMTMDGLITKYKLTETLSSFQFLMDVYRATLLSQTSPESEYNEYEKMGQPDNEKMGQPDNENVEQLDYETMEQPDYEKMEQPDYEIALTRRATQLKKCQGNLPLAKEASQTTAGNYCPLSGDLTDDQLTGYNRLVPTCAPPQHKEIVSGYMVMHGNNKPIEDENELEDYMYADKEAIAGPQPKPTCPFNLDPQLSAKTMSLSHISVVDPASKEIASANPPPLQPRHGTPNYSFLKDGEMSFKDPLEDIMLPLKVQQDKSRGMFNFLGVRRNSSTKSNKTKVTKPLVKVNKAASRSVSNVSAFKAKRNALIEPQITENTKRYRRPTNTREDDDLPRSRSSSGSLSDRLSISSSLPSINIQAVQNVPALSPPPVPPRLRPNSTQSSSSFESDSDDVDEQKELKSLPPTPQTATNVCENPFSMVPPPAPLGR